MKRYLSEKDLDDSLPKEYGMKAESDRVKVGFQAKNLKDLYRTRKINASSQEDRKIEEIASKLFNTLARLTACGSGVRVLEVVTVDEEAGKTKIDRAYQSNQEQNIKIEREDLLLAEELFRKQVPVADTNLRYILPYRYTGIWHCLFRSSEFTCIISVTEGREIKVTDRLWYNQCVSELTELQVVKRDSQTDDVASSLQNNLIRQSY